MTQADEEVTFSVITVVRNDAAGLLRTVESLDSQSRGNWQHVVVDGASTDGTAETALSLADERRVVWSEPDEGIYDAMNKGLALATGRLLVFMNAGDLFGGPDTLGIVESHYRTDPWLWAYGQQRFTEHGVPFAVSNHAPFDLRALTLGRKWLPHQAVYMERRFALDLGGFAMAVGSAADQELLVRAALRARPAVIFEYLADFEVGGLHDQERPLRREIMWHRIRAQNGVLLGRSNAVDVGFVALRWAEAVARQRVGAARRRLRRRIGELGVTG